MPAGRVLVVDDEESIRKMLSLFLENKGLQAITASTAEEALKAISEKTPDLVICDIKLPDMDGLEILKRCKESGVNVPFIVITAHTTPMQALESLKMGAVEYVSKPFDMAVLDHVIDRCLAQEAPAEPGDRFPEIVGHSAAIHRLLSLVPQVANCDSTVLITGDSGTGKELLARAIHANSPRASRPFVTVNCGALPEGLLESELFGHTKGSFTGALKDHPGLILEARGGTVFLDEVGELSPPMQVKLLRVLQERKVRPVGGTREIPVDVRFMAATNRNLLEEVKKGTFREDLFYRLNVIHLHIPPLKERPEDIEPLARHIVDRVCRRLGIPPKTLTDDALRLLQAYDWPGNVRELENVLERVVVLERGSMITSGSLKDQLQPSAGVGVLPSVVLPEGGIDMEQFLDEVRRALMIQALRKTGGSKKKAAQLLRLTYRSFRYYAEKFGLDEPASAEEEVDAE